MNERTHSIAALHQLYVDLTGLRISLDMGRERDWFEYMRKGFDGEDLRVVVAHIRRGIREQKRNQGALKFRNLIGQLDFFEEDLAEARAAARARDGKWKMENGKAQALRESGRLETGLTGLTGSERSAKSVIESEAFKEFVKMKGNL